MTSFCMKCLVGELTHNYYYTTKLGKLPIEVDINELPQTMILDSEIELPPPLPPKTLNSVTEEL